MSNPEHVALLRMGVRTWNENRPEWPNLAGEDLSGLDLTGISLTGAQISDANLRKTKLDDALLQGAFMSGSDLREASLRGANLYYTRLLHANLTDCDLAGAKMVGATLDGATLLRASLAGANLQNAQLSDADATECDFSDCSLLAATLIGTNLTRANLNRSVLGGASLVRAIVEGAVFDNAFVYGVGAWDLVGKPESSDNLRISSTACVTVTDLRVAQFVYLMLENEEVRTLIDTLTSKVVLILGRFFEARKATLDALRTELKTRGFVPVIFDFEQPSDRDVTETVTLLARMARFVFADVSDPRSVPQELYAIAPHVEVPIQPVILEAQEPYAMMIDLRKYQWVLPTARYGDTADLLTKLPELLRKIEQARVEIVARRSVV